MELVGVYGDQGFSGPHADNRLEFRRLIRDAVEGTIDHIIVEPISLFCWLGLPFFFLLPIYPYQFPLFPLPVSLLPLSRLFFKFIPVYQFIQAYSIKVCLFD